MDDFRIHLAAVPRVLPGPLPLSTIGWFAAKRERVRWAFPTVNLLVILAGEGEVLVDGRRHPVAAPALIVLLPGVAYDYGPTRTWCEYYQCHEPDCLPALRRLGLAERGTPVRGLSDPAAVRGRIEELRRLVAADVIAAEADRADRLGELLALSPLRPSGAALPRTPAARIRSLRQAIEADPFSNADLDRLARAQGLSTAQFRRHWQRAVGTPPARFRIQARLQSACRLLVESDEPIAAIARQVGFPDPLYFARRFRAAMATTPSAYRARYRSG